MKGCRTARARIDRAVDGRLALEDRFRLDEHLARCPQCAARFERATTVQELLDRGPEPPVDSLDVEQAVSAIRHMIDRDARTARKPRGSHGRRIAAAAAMVVFLAALWFAMNQVWVDDDASVDSATQDDHPNLPAENVTADGSAPDGAPADVAIIPPVDDELDPRRLEVVRGEVSERLQVAFAGCAHGADPDPYAALFDEATRELRRAQWPVLRLVEDLLLDSEKNTARAAARYVGVRGDRTSAVRLAATLEDSAARESVVRALGDLGAPAVKFLADALAEPDVADLAVAQLGRIGGRDAAEAIEEEILRAGDDAHRRDSVLYPNLVAAGPEAVASFLRLARANPDEAEGILAHLQGLAGADVEFARLARSSSARHPVSLLLDAAPHVQSPRALAWVEECSEDYRLHDAALACLARWSGPAPLEVVLRLDARGTVPDEDLLATLGELIDRDPERLTAFVEERLAARVAPDVERLLDLLLAMENQWTSESLVRIALSDLLSPEARQWAALAAGELGHAEDAERLLEGLARVDRGERRILAACLISIYVHLGPGGASRALEELAVRSSRRVLSALSEVDPSRTSAVGLHRVARALEISKLPKPRRSSL